jgi:tRNA 5-methylaminomethyl-2-thiouridine biosynthesis bifunctional protein
MTEPVDFSQGAPRSPRFDDTYFSAEDGLAESRAVFLAGCGLPGAWRGRRRFTVGELGFGTGLNILALLELWSRERPAPDARLHVFSVEGFPMAREDAATALAHWPELAALAAPLLARWPDRRGWRRYDWPDLGATLDLAIDAVVPALEGWTGLADAWFLDGFAPAKNPQMWREEVLALAAAKSAPGARVGSFTVAGAVRRGLESQGFAVARVQGFGRKKQRLEARLPGVTLEADPARVAILGAGIAGASLARAFRAMGVEARVFDPAGPGAGASGNAAALVTPRLDAGFGAAARLHAEAFDRAVHLYAAETPGAVIATGALQLETTSRDAARFAKIADWEGFRAGSLGRLGADGISAALCEADAPAGLALMDALVVEPRVILDAWLGPVERRRPEPHEADVVVVALGPASAGRIAGLPLQPVRGQVSVAEGPFVGWPAAWGGYAIPTRGWGVLFGATHDRGDNNDDIRATDVTTNAAYLAEGRPALAERLTDAPVTSRAAVRAATRDHMPVAGKVSDGLHVLTGLGGRGFTLAPILAEAVAAMVVGAPGPLPRSLLEAVSPMRFGR